MELVRASGGSMEDVVVGLVLLGTPVLCEMVARSRGIEAKDVIIIMPMWFERGQVYIQSQSAVAVAAITLVNF